MKDRYHLLSDDIMRCGQLAAALEVSGWPKPGNVHRSMDFPDTKFEHFIAGSIALGPIIRSAALRGIEIGLGKLDLPEVGVGKLVKDAVIDVNSWHNGGNTHLGISLLFIPLAVAAGLSYATNEKVVSEVLRENVREVMTATTVKDAQEVYDAILLASSAALGKLRINGLPDLTQSDAKKELAEQSMTLYDVMVASSKWDNISWEWTSGMEISFKTGYHTISQLFKDTKDPNLTIVHTFLTIISKHPDTFIARKIGTKITPYIEEAVEIGLKKTEWVSESASNILKAGGLQTHEGTRLLWELDRKLQSRGGELNPGTTADLTASSLMIAYLTGLRF